MDVVNFGPYKACMYSSTIKNSCNVLLLLHELAKMCRADTFRGFEGQDAEVILLGKWTTACAMLCKQTDNDHLEERLLRLRIQWLQHLGTHGARIWATAHVRMALWVINRSKTGLSPHNIHPQTDMCISTNLLPDPKKYLLQLPLFQSSQMKSPIGGAKCKLTHLLNKCLPKRCQIRELTRFLSEYCLSDSTVSCLFARMMFCSLCGIYAHCTETPPFGIVVSLCTTLLYKNMHTVDMTRWIKGTGCCSDQGNDNQLVCLHVIREYICVCVSSQPTLRAKLCKHFNWAKFEEVTFNTMQRIRMFLYMYCSHENFDLSGVRILDRFASALHKITPDIQPESTKPSRHSLQLKHLLAMFGKLRATQLKLLPTQDGRTLQQICHDVNICTDKCTEIGLVSRMQVLCKNDMTMLKVRRIIECVHCNMSESMTRKVMSELLHTDIFAYTMFECELRDTMQQLYTRVHMLPAGTHSMVPHLQPDLFYCTSCDTVANSCTDGKRNTTKSHVRSVKAIIDDDNCIMLCAQNTKHSMHSMTNLRTSTFDNCMAKVQCQKRPLLVTPICDRLIQVQNKLYSLCSSCGHVIKVEDGMQLLCKLCHLKPKGDNDKNICFMCSKKCIDLKSILCFSIRSRNMFELTRLCSSCLSQICKITTQQIVTRKQITEIYIRLQRKRALTIPGDRYNFFHSKS
jgi:hypothetical protein